MRAMAIQGSPGIDSLRPLDKPNPQPGHGQIVVRIRAASLNYRDLMTVTSGGGHRLPLVPLSDGGGEVVATGPGVRRVKTGDRVSPCFFQNWVAGRSPERSALLSLGGPLDGCLEEYLLLDEDGVVRTPDHLSDLEVATLPCAALTAWRALFVDARVQPGDVVLCQGTGGVSIFALQFAKAAGAEVILTSSSDDKLERGRTLGADHTINYRTHPEWSSEVRKVAPEGVDVVVEVGGAETLKESFKSIRMDGHIAIIGILSGTAQEILLYNFIRTRAKVQGISVGNRDEFEAMCRAISLHRIRPVIDRVFPFDQARDALRLMEAGGHFGKICIEI